MEKNIDVDNIFTDCDQKMFKAIDSLKKEFAKVRSGRASAAILDNVRADYYGAITPINQLGNIAVVDAGLITISPWEKKMLPEIEKAILKANLGLTPQNDGNVVRIPIQPLTEERRKELVKLIHKIAEEYKNSIRNLRREANAALRNLEKQKLLGEDELNKASDQVQKMTDAQIKVIENLIEKKESELLSV